MFHEAEKIRETGVLLATDPQLRAFALYTRFNVQFLMCNYKLTKHDIMARCNFFCNTIIGLRIVFIGLQIMCTLGLYIYMFICVYV